MVARAERPELHHRLIAQVRRAAGKGGIVDARREAVVRDELPGLPKRPLMACADTGGDQLANVRQHTALLADEVVPL